jgi:enoyl-CoA hydratase/carnithine racemase
MEKQSMPPYEIVMNGPGKNSLGTQMMDFLIAQLREADGKPVLITGAGDSFSAGLNLIEVSQLDASQMKTFLLKLVEMSVALFTYPGPTVALVNGHAIAGGCVIAFACDHRVGAANPKIKIGLNEVALGLRFPPAILSMARYRISPHALEAILLGARLYAPTDAQRLGLLDEVAEDPAPLARLRLEALASHPPAAYAATKLDLRQPVVQITEEEERRFVKEILPVWTAPEIKQRILAALKR